LNHIFPFIEWFPKYGPGEEALSFTVDRVRKANIEDAIRAIHAGTYRGGDGHGRPLKAVVLRKDNDREGTR